MKNSCLAAFLGFLITVSIGIFLLLFQFRLITNPTYLNKSLAQANIYAKLSPVLQSLIKQSLARTSENADDQVMANIASGVIIGALDEKALNDNIENADTAFLNYFNGKTDKVALLIDLKPYRSKVDQKWFDMAKGVTWKDFSKLPICNEKEEPIDQNGFRCQPKDLNQKQLGEIFHQSPDKVLTEFPETLDIGAMLKNTSPQLQVTRTVFYWLNIIYWANLALAVILILITLLLSLANIAGGFRLIGWAFFVASFPIFVIDLLGKNSLTLLKPIFSNISLGTRELIISALDASNRLLFGPTILVSSIILGLGIVLIILSYIIRPSQPAATPAKAGK